MSTWYKHLWERKLLFGSLLVIAIGAFFISQFVPEKWVAEFIIFFVPLIISLVAIFVTIDIADTSKYDRIIKKLTKKTVNKLIATQEDILESVLSLLYKEIGLGDNERVSIYCEQKHENKVGFRCVGRVSPNKQYNKVKPERVYLPKKGIIGKVWDGNNQDYCGLIDDPNFPDPSREEDYISYSKTKYNLYKNVTKHLRMKPVHMIATLLMANEEKLGVVVFESKERNKLNLSRIKRVLRKYQKLMRWNQLLEKPSIIEI